jgi:hypothetical protein
MFATLAAAALPRVPADMAPVFQALHQWLDGWKGIGDLVAGMSRQSYDLSLTQYPDGWRFTFYTTGREHSLTSRTGSAWEKTAALAFQRAAARVGNAVYRELIRSSLVVDAEYLCLGVMNLYRHRSNKKNVQVVGFAEAKNALDAIYASGRLELPFKGVLLFGY